MRPSCFHMIYLVVEGHQENFLFSPRSSPVNLWYRTFSAVFLYLLQTVELHMFNPTVLLEMVDCPIRRKKTKKQNWVLTKPRSSFAGSAPFLQPFYKCWCISVNRLSFVPSQNQTDILFCAICFIKVKHWHKSANIKLRSAGWKGS